MNPFATLGLPQSFDVDGPELEARYRDLQRALHPDRHVGAPPNERRLSLSKAIEVNAAYRLLKNDIKRAEALLSLTEGEGATGATQTGQEPADPELLMEVMELREALSDAKVSRDVSRVQTLADTVRGHRAESLERLRAAFAEVSTDEARSTSAATLQAARAAVARLKYYERFLDEVVVIEDELL